MGPGAFRQRFETLLQKVDLVTFDVFDTALVRGVARPEGVFLQMAIEAQANGILSQDLLERQDFIQARIKAETEARRQAWETHGWVEIRLEEIHARLAVDLRLDEPSAQALMSLEQRIELAHGLRNPFVGGLFDLAKGAGKRIGFISDMYLDETLVASLLEQAGYGEYEFLLVSSSGRETKASGSLFKKVLNTQQIVSRKWLHVGDNPDSDVRRARELGIHALHYEKCETRSKSHRGTVRQTRILPPDHKATGAGLFDSIVNGLIAARYFASPDAKAPNGDTTDFWTDWGYQHAGPLLAGFGSWIVREVSRHAFRDVYFLSRDGYLIKQVVDRMLRAGFGAGQAVRPHYLYASRRAFNLAAIEKLDEDSQDFLVSGTSRMTPRQFLARIDIDIDRHLDAAAGVGFASPDEVVEGALGYGRLRALLRELGDIVLERAQSELDALNHYFREEGLLGGGQVAIVDLGWHGTLQNAMDGLIRRMGATTRLTGYYMGTFPAAKRYADRGQEMHGYLCEEGKPVERHAAIRTSVELFEWIFSAPHGSVCNFRAGTEGIEPVFAEFGFESERWEAASAMQAGVFRFIDDYLRIWRGQTLPEVPPAEALRRFHAALAHPTPEEARRLGNLQHAEGFGRVAVPRYIAKPPGSIWNPLSYPRLFGGIVPLFAPGYMRNLLGNCRHDVRKDQNQEV
jgi:predicted HAD superfamily hydrolase